MSRTYVSSELRRLVRQRARDCCEYCLLPELVTFAVLQVDHIVAEKHRGPTDESNLALSCAICNSRKGTDLTSIDPDTSLVVLLFNPRRDRWQDHFHLTDGRINPLSATGRVTEQLLHLNEPHLVETRRLLLTSGFDLLPAG